MKKLILISLILLTVKSYSQFTINPIVKDWKDSVNMALVNTSLIVQENPNIKESDIAGMSAYLYSITVDGSALNNPCIIAFGGSVMDTGITKSGNHKYIFTYLSTAYDTIRPTTNGGIYTYIGGNTPFLFRSPMYKVWSYQATSGELRIWFHFTKP
jgi:hypothetical protein